jgi:hypothetical protein
MHSNYTMTASESKSSTILSAENQKEILCKFNMHGKCSKGDLCPFKHKDTDDASASNPGGATSNEDASEKKRAVEVLGKYSTSNVYLKKQKRAGESAIPDEEKGNGTALLIPDSVNKGVEDLSAPGDKEMIDSVLPHQEVLPDTGTELPGPPLKDSGSASDKRKKKPQQQKK